MSPVLWDGQHTQPGLPLTASERAQRRKIILVGLITLLTVVGTYRAGYVKGSEPAAQAVELAETYRQAVDDLRERERLSMDYIREYDPSLARELDRRLRLWGDR